MKYPFKIGLMKDEFDVLLHVISKQPIESCLFNLYDAYRDWETDRKSTRLNSSHSAKSRMPSSA